MAQYRVGMGRTVAERLSTPLLGYAAQLHRAILDRAAGDGSDGHHVASPLGAWLLLGLVAHAEPVAPGTAAGDALAAALGCPLAEAAELTDTVLGTPHPAVAAAAAAWLSSTVEAVGIHRLLAQLPCRTGGLPTRAEADRWVKEHTRGLIDSFPADLDDPQLRLLLTTAVATRVAWYEPFEVVAAHELGDGPFAGRLTRAMRLEPGAGHYLGIHATDVGPVAVHVGEADGLTVHSVAADPAVSAAQVLEVALGLATDMTRVAQRPGPRRLSLWDLPLGDGPAWTIREIPAEVTHPRAERMVDVVMPAWDAQGTHDLVELGAGTGFGAAGQLLAPLLEVADFRVAAAQTTLARFDRHGFEAAALTMMAMAGGMPPPPTLGRRREARLRFAHPYAVVVVAEDPTEDIAEDMAEDMADIDTWQPHPWRGIPVCSAWIAQVRDCEPTSEPGSDVPLAP